MNLRSSSVTWMHVALVRLRSQFKSEEEHQFKGDSMSKWTRHAILKSNMQLANLIMLSNTPRSDAVNEMRFQIIEQMQEALEESRKDLNDVYDL